MIEAVAAADPQRATGTDDQTAASELANSLATKRENRHKVATTGTHRRRQHDDECEGKTPVFPEKSRTKTVEVVMARAGIEPATLRFSVGNHSEFSTEKTADSSGLGAILSAVDQADLPEPAKLAIRAIVESHRAHSASD